MRTITIGRSSKNDIKLENSNISRRHAEIVYKPDGIVIVDKSSNGTWVNGKRLSPNKEYFIYRGDKIRFAGVVELDWGQVPEKPPSLVKSLLKTNLSKDFLKIVKHLADIGGLSRLVAEFWRIVRGGSNRIYDLAHRPGLANSDYLPYYLVGLTAFLLCLTKAMPLLSAEESELLKLSKVVDNWSFIGELGASLLLAFLTFVLAACSYKIFKWYTNASNKHWDQYFRIYCYTFGTAFWLVAFMVCPIMLACMWHAKPESIGWLQGIALVTKLGLALLFMSTFYIWVKLNNRFWD